MILNSVSVFMRTAPINAEVAIESFFDLTSFVKNITINRGKSSSFTEFSVASATVELNNYDRIFDPTNDQFRNIPEMGAGAQWNSSIYMSRRQIVKIGVDGSFGASPRRSLFWGYTADWNLEYDTSGESIATLTLYDFSGLLEGIPMDAETPSEELTGTRFETLFDQYKPGGIDIGRVDDGTVTLGTQPIEQDTRLRDYLNLIAKTEGGLSYQNRTGQQRFLARIRPSFKTPLTFGEDGIGITKIGIEYGTELLYNRVEVQNEGGSLVVVEDTDSQDDNGVIQLAITGLIGANDTEALSLATHYINLYSVPKLRIREIDINWLKYDEPGDRASDIQDDLAQLDLGDYIVVKFQPNGTGDFIERTLEIISIRHTLTPGSFNTSYTLDEKQHNTFILNDEVFGKLDTNQLG